jgi:L-lactate utilization protein LutC
MSGAPPETLGPPDPKYARLASEGQLDRAASRLREHGLEVLIVATAEEARREVLSRIPPGSEVLDATSRTLEEIGVAKALAEIPGITLVKPRLRQLDRKTQADEIRRLSQAPGVVVGSVHAITEDGQVLAASATGSQIGPYAYGAGRVIWVAGAQKIVPTLQDALDRIERYALPLEDARAHQAYGVGSSINRILIFRREHQPGRTTLILVKEKLGF